MIIQQISIFLENRVGQLTEMTTTLADAGVDLMAINIAETSDYGVVRIITDNNETAEKVLAEHEYVFSLTPVVVVNVPDVVGGLAGMLKKLAAADIDIEYMYSIFSRHENMAQMIFKVADPEALEEMLSE